MKRASKIVILAAILLTALGLTACQSPVHGTTYPTMMQDHRLTRPIDHDLLTQINHEGVHIIRQGSQLVFLIPITRFFKLTSQIELRERSSPTLELISLYLHIYVKQHRVHYPIKVYAYTDLVPDNADRYEYSRQYAQVVAAYMWARGFLPSQMQVIGYGAENPIADNATVAGANANDRVVIQVN